MNDMFEEHLPAAPWTSDIFGNGRCAPPQALCWRASRSADKLFTIRYSTIYDSVNNYEPRMAE
jgi:hypothetical protein